MKFRDWMKGKEAEEGVEIDDLEAVFSGSNADDLSKVKDEVKSELDAKDAEIAALKEAQKVTAANFARMADERRQADAVTFARGLVSSKRITPVAAEKLAPLAARIAASDSSVTFSDGDKSTSDLLREFCESLPDFSIFTTEHIKPEQAAAIFNLTETEGVSKPKDITQERIDSLLSLTPIGKAAVADRKANHA